MKYCPECGKELTEGMKFCSECGTNLTQIPSTLPMPSEPKIIWERGSLLDAKKEDLIGLIISIIYLVVAILAWVVIRGYGHEIGELYCMSINLIFLVLFIFLIIIYIKKAGSHMMVGIMFITLSMLIGFVWAYSEYTNAYYETGFCLFIWPVILLMGFIFLISSLFESNKK